MSKTDEQFPKPVLLPAERPGSLPVLVIYYSISDAYPAYRVDLSELMARALSERGLRLVWFMAASEPSIGIRARPYFGAIAYTPPKSRGAGFAAKAINRLAYWTCDCFLLLRASFSQGDILQVRDKYLASLAGLLLAKLRGRIFVYWCSYPFPEHAIETARGKTRLSRTLLNLRGRLEAFLLYRVVMRYADHSFVQSEQMLQDVEAYGVPRSRMTSVPMGVPQRLLDWARQTNAAVHKERVVYLGTLASIRRLEVVIEAFALVRKQCETATLLIVGEGDFPHERQALEQLANHLGLSSCIQFTGFVPIEQAWTYAATAAVCLSPIYPSRVLAAGSPTKLVEYMALGRPVVCNAHPDQSRIIGESGAGIRVEWGAKEFAEAMVWMLEHPLEAEAMGAKGPAWVAANRTYPIIADAVWKKYQEIVGHHA
jgi:glycosyltransferase involved in cell wall biosynthesis